MSDIEFFREIVQPTIEDFVKRPGDIRLGVLACLVLQAMNEHYYQHNRSDLDKVRGCADVDAFKHALRMDDWAFGQIMDVANATKHVHTRSGKKFSDLHHEVPGACGVMRCGFPISAQKYVFIDEENAWLLCQLVEYVTEKWSATLGLASAAYPSDRSAPEPHDALPRDTPSTDTAEI